jgi:hypothetical protein
MKKRGTALGDELDRLTKRLTGSGGVGVKQVLVHQAWQNIAGATVLEHTTGAHLRSHELIVYVDSPLWATELSALSEHYRSALNTELGEELVSEVRFSVSKRVEESARLIRLEAKQVEHLDPDPTPSLPLTAQERAQVEASAAVIEDEELREAVIRATVADLEWKKGIEAAKLGETAREGA